MSQFKKKMISQDIVYCNNMASKMYLAGDYERGEYYANEAKRMSALLADARETVVE